jgi:hypothetical protein
MGTLSWLLACTALAAFGPLAFAKGASSMSTSGQAVVKIGGEQVTARTHVIVLPEKPTPQEQHAAGELQAHLQKITGEQLAVASDSEVGDRTPLVIGKSAVLEGLGAPVDFAALGEEGIRIATVGPALVLAGNRRGVLYAVSTFLEDYLGCRWFTPDCTALPTAGTFEVKDIDLTYVPPLEYRSTDYPNSRDADWAVRNKLNGSYVECDEARGGKIAYRGFVHTFNSLVPPETYFQDHPEYYSEIDGKRKGPHHTQLCLTNSDVLRIATESIRRWMEESPEATVYSVSQNDWEYYCQCANCQALAEKEGSEAGPLLHFVNAIADAVKDEHPTKAIDTLAYQYTRKPPLHVRPRPNVIVRLCSIECCFSHPLESDLFNATFREDNERWAKISNRLWVWDYVINYLHCIMPFPNLYVLKPNINFYVQHGVTGIYEEADYFTKGGELAELRTYVLAKTLWDPGYDTDRAIDEFVAGYYGPAAKPVREYLNLIHEPTRTQPEVHMGIYVKPDWGYLTPELLTKAAAFFDEAEQAAAEVPVLLHRVQVARLPVIYAQLSLGGRDLPGRANLLDRFETIARAEGATHVAEWGDTKLIETWLAKMRE